MSTKSKGRDRANGTTPQRNYDTKNYIKTDPLIAWFNLAKPARERQKKAQKGGRHGNR